MNSKNLPKIRIFWDIDGTLLRTNGAAAIPFMEAVSNFINQEVVINRKELSGFTDYEIVAILLKNSNYSVKKYQIREILNEYLRLLPSSLESGIVEKIPNIEETLTAIEQTTDIELCIGSGNCLSGAKIKLNHVNLLKYFSLGNIYCASEKYWSRELIIKNAKSSLMRKQVGLVIGDSPRDIEVAKSLNLKVIAVGSGSHSELELLECKPNAILNPGWNYSDLLHIIHQIL